MACTVLVVDSVLSMDSAGSSVVLEDLAALALAACDESMLVFAVDPYLVTVFNLRQRGRLLAELREVEKTTRDSAAKANLHQVADFIEDQWPSSRYEAYAVFLGD